MTKTLKTTGLAADARFCLVVDDDGVTLRELVSGRFSTWNGVDAWTDSDNTLMVVDTPVVVGSASWKGATRNYFETFASGTFEFSGVRFPSNISLPSGRSIASGGTATGFTVFLAVAGATAGGGNDNGRRFVSFTSNNFGIQRDQTSGLGEVNRQEDQTATTSVLPADGVTPYALAGTHHPTIGEPFRGFFGLEPNTLALEVDDVQPGNWSTELLQFVGGVSGAGSLASKFHIVVIFEGTKTLAELQPLMTDWEAELFQTAADTTAPIYSVVPAIDSVTDASITADATAADETDATVDHLALVLADGGVAPADDAEFLTWHAAGAGSNGVLAVGTTAGVANGVEGSITLTGSLSASTAYDVYYAVQDSSGNLNLAAKLDATTSAAPINVAVTGSTETTIVNSFSLSKVAAITESTEVDVSNIVTVIGIGSITFTNLADQDGQLVPATTQIDGIWWPDVTGTGAQDWSNLNATPEPFSVTLTVDGELVITGITSGSGLLALRWIRTDDGLIHRHNGRYTIT